MKENAMLWGNAPRGILRRFDEWLQSHGHHATPTAKKLGELWIDFCSDCECSKKGNR